MEYASIGGTIDGKKIGTRCGENVDNSGADVGGDLLDLDEAIEPIDDSLSLRARVEASWMREEEGRGDNFGHSRLLVATMTGK